GPPRCPCPTIAGALCLTTPNGHKRVFCDPKKRKRHGFITHHSPHVGDMAALKRITSGKQAFEPVQVDRATIAPTRAGRSERGAFLVSVRTHMCRRAARPAGR